MRLQTSGEPGFEILEIQSTDIALASGELQVSKACSLAISFNEHNLFR